MAKRQTKQTLPPQHQTRQPGIETEMRPQPASGEFNYTGAERYAIKLHSSPARDSGIGRAVAIAFAKEGADVAIVYLNEHSDASATKRKVEDAGRRCLLIAGDVGDEVFCRHAVEQTVDAFRQLDIVVNNAAEQHPQESIATISREQLERTFRTNIFSMFYLTQAALPYLTKGARIINSISVTAYRGSPQLLDYSATKGAIVAFTRSLSLALIDKGIYVNAVAPGPIWTPLVASSFSEDKVASFGGHTPMGRPGQPAEVAPAYVFLACTDASYMSGLHPNGGEVVNA